MDTCSKVLIILAESFGTWLSGGISTRYDTSESYFRKLEILIKYKIIFLFRPQLSSALGWGVRGYKPTLSRLSPGDNIDIGRASPARALQSRVIFISSPDRDKERNKAGRWATVIVMLARDTNLRT